MSTDTDRADSMTMAERLMMGDRPIGEILLGAQKMSAGSPYLFGEEPPTPNQVSAVLHALAWHGLQAHMNSETVLALGDDRSSLGGTWRQDTAHGRFFQALGDSIATWPDLDAKAREEKEKAERVEEVTQAVRNYREGYDIDQRDTDVMVAWIESVLGIPDASEETDR